MSSIYCQPCHMEKLHRGKLPKYCYVRACANYNPKPRRGRPGKPMKGIVG